ncbi:gag-pol polyprotein [Lasius niger]|uniref:Gag-pol polyprotein n=1 Tax=Lasius niger TaxID=67767 RepID=A0A0J7NHJ8_LASNI|nr:gag-pol polyprotein [Lasius niger]
MASNNVLPPIERLVGRDNYTTWKFAIQSYLELEDLWAAVQGTEEDLKKITRARAKIVLAVDPVNFVHLQGTTTAKEAWDALRKAFDDSGLTRRVGLLRKLVTTQLDKCRSIEEYVTQIITTAHQLNSVGLEVKDEWIGTLLLAGLPESYKPMIMGLESSGTPITGDSIKTKLLQEVRSDNQGVKGQNHETAFYGKRVQSKRPKGKFKCYTCNEIGHFSSQCPKGNKKNKDSATKESKDSETKDSKSNKQRDVKAFFTGTARKDDWFVDSGASAHMTGNREYFTQIHKAHLSHIIVANDVSLSVQGTGDVKVKISLHGTIDQITVKDVLYVPGLSPNLLSVSEMTAKGLTLKFEAETCQILDSSNKIMATATQINGAYRLDRPQVTAYSCKEEEESAELWHRRLGHLGRTGMKLLRDKHAKGLRFESPLREPCVICCKGKQHRQPHPSVNKRTKQVLELLHMDLCGPMENTSLGGSRYFMTIVDDHSRKIFIYFLEKKSQALECFEDFKKEAENQMERKIKAIRTDNGKEFVNKEFSAFLRDSGIHHQTTIPHTPQQNGLAERMNRTIVERARCLLAESELPTTFWAEASSTAVYLINRSPARAIQHRTPEEIWSGEKPKLQHLRVFGCEAMVHVPKECRRKWDMKSDKCIFLGYLEDGNGYRLYHESSQKIIKARDVVFIENIQRKRGASLKQTATKGIMVCEETLNHNPNEPAELSDDSSNSLEFWDADDEQEEPLPSSGETSSTEEQEQATEPEETTLRRSTRKPAPRNFKDYVTYKAMVIGPDDPITLQEALESEACDSWQQAMRNEYDALLENKTWDLVDLPPGRKPLKCKWVFKTKRDSNNDVERYKARLVVKGFSQVKGLDYEETYSPVVRYASIRILLALAAKLDLEVDHLDVVTAFLQGDLSEEIYMEQPEGSVTKGEESKVCLLRRPLYGLKQGSFEWNRKLDSALKSLGFTRSNVDQGIYIKHHDSKLVIIAVYVDDLLLLSNDVKAKNLTKKQLHKKFEMKDLGAVRNLLGMQVHRDREQGKIFINQATYIDNILRRFNMCDCNPARTPSDPNQRLDKSMAPKSPDEVKDMEKVPYREALGSMMFLCQGTRPDIAHAITSLSVYSENPGKAHWAAVKRLFRYLKGTRNYGLIYSRDTNPTLQGFCDADWAGDTNDRRSTTGYLFTLQGAALAKKQFGFDD